MKKLLLLLSMSLLLAGCASPNVKLNPSFWQQHQSVKVTKNKMPHASLYQAGQQGLLDIAISSAVTTSFRDYLKQYRLTNIESIPNAFVQGLNANGVKASRYRDINLENLPKRMSKLNRYADHDFSRFAVAMGNNKLLVISVNAVGAVRRYYGFIPLDAPKATCILEGRLVDVKTNRILWRYKSSITLPVDGKWDQPPNYPNFTRTLNKAISLSRSQLLDNFFSGTSGQ